MSLLTAAIVFRGVVGAEDVDLPGLAAVELAQALLADAPAFAVQVGGEFDIVGAGKKPDPGLLKRVPGFFVARKIFQHFAQVLCQRFIEVPSNRDLVNLALFGGGILVLDITGRKATCNRYPIEPLPYAEEARIWLEDQITKHEIPPEQLVSAVLIVEYSVTLSHRLGSAPIPSGSFNFSCAGTIMSPDRKYTSQLKAEKIWGLGQV